MLTNGSGSRGESQWLHFDRHSMKFILLYCSSIRTGGGIDVVSLTALAAHFVVGEPFRFCFSVLRLVFDVNDLV